MADDSRDTPLLHPYRADANPEPEEEGKSCSITSLDDVIERCVGSIGAAQLLQAFLVSLACAFDAQQTFIVVFTDTAPSWHCTAPDGGYGTSNTCSSTLSQPCGLPAGAWAWDRPSHVSVISEWSLECAGSSVTGLPATAYFAGSLVGGLALGTLADSTLGRKKMLFFACLGTGVAGLLTAASPDVWVYSALRFVSGFCRATINSSALVLSTELVGKDWRGQVGVVGYFCFTLGFLSLPLLAYAERYSSWRTLYLWTSAPPLLYAVLVYVLAHESPKWLLVRGRMDEAIKVLKDIAASNGKDVLADSEFSDVFVGEEEWNKGVSLYSALRMVVAKRWALRRVGLLMVAFFGIGMLYNGMPLALGTLGPDLSIYISVALNALAELPSALVTFFLIGRMERRSAVLGFALASGACSGACVFLEEAGLRMAVEVASFFCACTAFDVVLIYALELFPTSVRSSALSLARPTLVLGGACAPLLVSAASAEGGRFLSFGVFGLVITCCGLFVVFLPETRGRRICDTLEEEEHGEKYAAAVAAGAGDGGDDELPRV